MEVPPTAADRLFVLLANLKEQSAAQLEMFLLAAQVGIAACLVIRLSANPKRYPEALFLPEAPIRIESNT